LPPVSAGSGPVSSFLPPPKHSLGLGAGSGAGARRSAIDTAAPEKPNLGTALPSSSVANTGAPERPDTGATDEDDSEDSGSEGDMPAPELEDEHENQQAFNAATGEQQQSYDAGAGSTSGYETYAWDPNHYAQYDAYGWDPSASANYEDGTQYAAYERGQSAGYVHAHGGEHASGYDHVAAVPSGVDYTAGGYGHEVAATLPPVHEPILPPEMGRSGGKRGRNDTPVQILEVNQAELMKNRPKQDKSKLTGLAFGPSYQVQIHHCLLTLFLLLSSIALLAYYMLVFQ
jgi:proline-rich protein PRCC